MSRTGTCWEEGAPGAGSYSTPLDRMKQCQESWNGLPLPSRLQLCPPLPDQVGQLQATHTGRSLSATLLELPCAKPPSTWPAAMARAASEQGQCLLEDRSSEGWLLQRVLQLPKTGLREQGGSPSAYLGEKSDLIASWQAVHHMEEPEGCIASEGDGACEASESS